MRDETSGALDARIWVKEAEGPILIGERFRGRDGLLTMAWHINPKSIYGVMWVEDIIDEKGNVSAS